MAGNSNSGRKAGSRMESVYVKLPAEEIIEYKRAAKAHGNVSLSAYLRIRLQLAKDAETAKTA